MLFFVQAPAAYVSRVHYEPQYVVAIHEEIPDPDHEYLEGHLWVNTITGGPNEFESPPQVSFAIVRVTPLRKPEFSTDTVQVKRAQTRALSRTYHDPSKLRGR